MDQINAYDQTVMDVLNERAEYIRPAMREDETVQTLYDVEQGHYMLVYIGWKGYERIFSVQIYIRIENNMIWIEEDETEDGIATELLMHGVPNNHIILAFYHKDRRELTEFAVA